MACCGVVKQLLKEGIIWLPRRKVQGSMPCIKLGKGYAFVNFCPSCGEELPCPYKEEDIMTRGGNR